MREDAPTLYSYEFFKPYKQLYEGVVVDNEDPKQLGRVKVEVTGLTLGIDKKYLPWYNIMLPAFLGGSMYTSQFAIPQLNTRVYVMFPSDDVYAGLVIGSVLSRPTRPFDQLNRGADYLHPQAQEHHFTKNWDKADAKTKNQKHWSPDFSEDYPYSWGWVSNAFSWFKENMIKRTIEFVHNSFTRFKIYSNGDTIINITGNLKLIVEKDFYLEVRGNYDQIINNSSYHHTIGNKVEVVEKMKFSEAKMGRKEKGQTIVLN